MASFRVVYSRGSFAFAIACDTREQALTRALAISREAGVWHVHVEDGHGTRSILPELPGPLKIEMCRSVAASALLGNKPECCA